MLLSFEIEYKTWLGQQMMIVGSLPELGGGLRELARPLEYSPGSGGLWTFRLEVAADAAFTYRYFIRDNNFSTTINEWGNDRLVTPDSMHPGILLLKDRWRTLSDPGYALYSSAFTRSVFRPGKVSESSFQAKTPAKNSLVVRFRPSASRVKPGQRLTICGSPEALRKWDVQKAGTLGNCDFPVWNAEVAIPVSEFPVKYKYALRDPDGATLLWEKSADRILSLPRGFVPDVIEVRDEQFDFPGDPWRGAGVAIPVFSLRRENGFGTGEFTDLKLLADWAVKAGLKMIQILPVNDTVARHSWQDSYPYAAISVFALHPIYVNLMEIGRLSSEITSRIMEAQGAHLNALAKIDYEAVMAMKSRFFKLIYDQQKSTFLTDPGFLEFYTANQYWLRPYAAFSYLRDLFNTPDFTCWDGFAVPSQGLLDELTNPASPHYDDIAVHYFIQYHAHRQLLDAASYARAHGIVLKGDIPIGIFRNSVDAWINPGLYHMESQAGAPPDDFSATGQNWRFPTYNWVAMASDQYAWWQKRLRHLSMYFDAFRIDHILGFFRIWEIPASQVQGLMGYFNPSIPYSREEILGRGIYFDENRFCTPYIREHFLTELFGELTGEVKANYLESYAPGCYRLIPALDTQQKIEAYLTPSQDDDAARQAVLSRLKGGLFSLAAEVLFLEAPGIQGKAWVPRNSFHATHSYRELDPQTQYLLDQLYIDYFYRRNEDFWREKALQKLPAIQSATAMLLCGEDLGMVPACVPDVMKELGILSLEVQRMPKDPKTEFGHPSQYPYLSVATPSSHDTSTLRGWWEENPEKTQKFFNLILGNEGPAPQTCTPGIVKQIIVQHLWSPAMWAVFPLQDLLAMDDKLRYPDPHAERINQPANPNHYWRYRMHLNLEELLKQKEFTAVVQDLIAVAGRI